MIIERLRATCVLIALAGTALLSGCASTAPIPTPPANAALQRIPANSSIRIVGVAPTVNTPDVDTAGETVALGTVGGAGAGAIAGAGGGAAAGLACGPYFIVCSPVMAIAGAAVGTVVGAVAVGTYAAVLAVPAEQAQALEAIMAEAVTDLGNSKPLVEGFEAESEGRWKVTDTGPATQIRLTVEQLYIDQGANDMLVVKMVNSMVVTYDLNLLAGASAPDTTKRVLFRYESPEQHVDYWIADDGANFRAAIDAGYTGQIAEMIAALERGVDDMRLHRIIPGANGPLIIVR